MSGRRRGTRSPSGAGHSVHALLRVMPSTSGQKDATQRRVEAALRIVFAVGNRDSRIGSQLCLAWSGADRAGGGG